MKKYLYSLATDKREGILAGILKLILFLASFIYGLAIKFILFCYRRGIFRRQSLNCKVISVGNITLGGTGKTPFVELIAKYLKARGQKVAILSRGYGSKIKNQKSKIKNLETMGDEPLMLFQNLGNIPIIVNNNRIKAAQQARENYQVDTVILDDGFQQWGIEKNLEIVMIDADSPFGNRRILPRGILREPLSSLSRADIFVLTRNLESSSTLEKELQSINPHALILEANRKSIGLFTFDNQEILKDTLKDKKVCLLASIGNPDSFYTSIVNLGFKPLLKFFFLDHHNYSESDIENLLEYCHKSNIKTIITTQKDIVRLEKYRSLLASSYSLFYLRMELEITKNKDEFYSRLSGLYRS